MAKIKGANAVLDVMYKWGIDHLYGFPGDSKSGVHYGRIGSTPITAII
ncbi:hypothetical protein ACIA39_06095 [Lactobacillus delbrueckii subsp. bulgaricus]